MVKFGQRLAHPLTSHHALGIESLHHIREHAKEILTHVDNQLNGSYGGIVIKGGGGSGKTMLVRTVESILANRNGKFKYTKATKVLRYHIAGFQEQDACYG